MTLNLPKMESRCVAPAKRMPNHPGWIFLPPNLEFFITHEEKDYQSHTQAAKHGILAHRTCPGHYRLERGWRFVLTNLA